MNPFCLKLDFLRNRLRMAYFWFLRYVFFLILMLSGIYTPIYWLWKFSKYRSYSSLASIEVTQVSQVV